MISLRYPLTGDEEPNEELEDELDRLMGDSDYGRCGDGGVSGEVREVEYEGDTGQDDRDFKDLTFLHQQILDLDPRIKWEIYADEEDD